jgi:arylsulfatase A-like enzyme
MKPNLILVLLDGSRWDRLHISPELMQLTEKGTLLNNVTTVAPYTFASVNGIFTGLYGKENGVNAYFNMFKLKESVEFLPEILKKNGYITSCDLISDKVISSRGFDIYQSHNEYADDLLLTHPELLKKTFELAGEKPIFAFLQFSKIHTATVSEVLKKYEWNDKTFYEKKDQNLTVYDNSFLVAGKYAKTIYDELASMDKLDNSIIVFFSDHGTGVGERFGERNYGVYLFEETIRTFYLFIGPNINKNKKYTELSSTINILPM